jgi:hypothetical protein
MELYSVAEPRQEAPAPRNVRNRFSRRIGRCMLLDSLTRLVTSEG